MLAGGTAAAVNWLVRFPLSAIMPFSAAVIAAAVTGMMVGFISCRIFVFPGSSRHVGHQLRDFVLVNLPTLAAVAITAMVLRSFFLAYMSLQLTEAFSHAMGIAVGAVLNCAAHSAITFQRRAIHPGTETEN